MSAWCSEKSEYLLSELSKMVDSIKLDNSITPDLKDSLSRSLEISIHNALKLYTFSTNSKWSIDDISYILLEGTKGFEKLQKKYGIIKYTKSERKKIEIENIFIKLFLSIKKEKVEGRQLFYEIITRQEVKEILGKDLFEKLLDLYDRLMMNMISWEEFKKGFQSIYDNRKK